MSLTLTVHRGTRQIGGTCIEIQDSSGERLILDAGRPLDAPEGANDIVPASLDRNRPATVVISHPHQDHWGAVEQLPASWPIWTGSKAAQLIAIPCDLLRRPKGRVFVTWSGQNIDRTVTLYRAARRTRRTLVIDLYTADVLDRISIATRLPRAGPEFPNLKVVITKKLRSTYANCGREDFIARLAQFGLAAKHLVGGRHVIMLRRALIPDYEKAGVEPNADDAYNFSMWQGYLSEPYHRAVLDWCQDRGSEVAYIHTSGHASPNDLRAFAVALQPKVVVPVHSNGWDEHADGFGKVMRLSDGEQYTIA